MTTLTKTRKTIATAAAFMLAMTASMIIFDTAHGASSVSVTQSTEDASNSVRVTQSTEDGLEVECEGNLNCKIIGDDTVVGTSRDNNTTTTTTNAAVTTNLNQSNTIQSNSNFDAIDEQEDLGAMIEGMVDRLLDEISGKLANLAIFI
jgi:uncharacterized protein YdeI (BOF family)